MIDAPMPAIDAALVARLIASQFPQWAHLPVTPVEPGGWDNRTFRLGDTLSVRLPSAPPYAPQVAKEDRWLPVIAPHLPLPVPRTMGTGSPGEGYPCPWSVRGWLDGAPADDRPPADTMAFARDLAGFLRAMHAIDARQGPRAGDHSFHRGGALVAYDAETRRSIETLGGTIDARWAHDIWAAARASRWNDTPVWVHGDIAPGNLLVDKTGHLTAVIDFGCMATGDPACDLVIAWTVFDRDAREVFHNALPHLDHASWQRARGWALWKAVITLAAPDIASPAAKAVADRTMSALAADAQ